MTARQIAKWGLIGWAFLLFLQIGMSSAEADTGFFLPALGTLCFIAIFAQHIYDWTRSRTDTEDRVLFLMEFADLLRLGIPSSEALAKLVSIRSHQYAHRYSDFTRSLREVSGRVAAGGSLEVALLEVRGIPRHWGDYAQFCEDPKQMASLMESLAQAERSHLAVPYLSALRIQLLLPMVFGVSIFLQTYIVPTFAEMFQGMNLTMPATTRFVMAFNQVLHTTKLDYVLIAVALYIMLALGSEKSRKSVFQVLYYIPIGRDLVKLTCQSHLFRMVGAGLRFGVPQRECLQAAANRAQVYAYKRFLSSAAANPADSFSQRLLRAPRLFSPHLIWLIQQGEELENLPDSLLTASEVAHQEVEQKMARVGVYLDTFILLLIGLYVGLTVVSLFVPLYQLIGKL